MSIVKEFLKLKNGPWGSYEEDKPGPQKKAPQPTSENEFDKFTKNIKDFFRKIFGGGSKNNWSGNRVGDPKSQRPLAGIITLSVIAIWLSTGLYKVDSDENAVVLYFGKFHSITTPGLNYYIPAPIGKIIKKSVTKVETEEFGSNRGSSSIRNSTLEKGYDSLNTESESLMLTGDENIVDIDFQIQWQISNIKDYVFNLADQNLTIRKAAESAMREVIARTPIADALSDGKRQIEQDTKILLQQILDDYGAGVKVVLVQMLRVDPPKQVIDAFRDVQTAKADKEKEINQAQAYRNDIIPRARGEAVKLTEGANAYKEQVVADAKGQASRFISVYNEYQKARMVTKKRMYLETMENLYQKMDKVIIDDKAGKGVVPYLPLNEIKKKQ